MSEPGFNADLSKLAIVRTATTAWQASHSPTVWRKRLDLVGSAESSRVTAVVRYDADSAFHSHPHPNGEEILVLDGVFSDEHGDYPACSYLLNPEGFEHAPFSRQGCVLFVKLQQYPGLDRQQITIDTTKGEWRPGAMDGVAVMPLYAEDAHSETVYLARLGAGAGVPDHDHPAGEEVFVLDGSFADEHGDHPTGSWVRYPPGSRHSVHSEGGCMLYVKNGHLPS
jgi:anti-sigma factor ChrR (cupin superfamily)